MLGILSDEDFNRELNKDAEVLPIQGEVRDKTTNSRGKDNNAIPNSLRRVIGEEATINGSDAGKELARQFGINDGHVGALKKGSTSLSTYNKQPNLNYLNSRRLRISKKATKVLSLALEEITSENRLSACSAVELAGVAKSMSGIVKDMEPELPKNGNGDSSNGPTYVFYSPQVKQENHYEMVHVRE